jgi:signal transduction histidine kinase
MNAGPVYVRRGSGKETLIADGEMRGRHASYWSYPLDGLGVIQLGFATEYPWLPRELTLMSVAAGRCREAIARADDRRTIGRLETAARAAEEDERRRIGRELHDEAGQSLMLLRLKLEMLEREAPPDVSRRIGEARGIVENTVVELRRIIAALSPAVLERLGLERALRQLALRFRKTCTANVRVRIEGPCERLADRTQQVIYRVVQEGFQNIAKHSRATHVNLSLRVADKNIRLRLSDDGVGLGAEPAWRRPECFGLAGMRERAALLGGRLSIESTAGKGAVIILELPNAKNSSTAH